LANVLLSALLSVCLLLSSSSPKSAGKESRRIRRCRNAAAAVSIVLQASDFIPVAVVLSLYRHMLHHVLYTAVDVPVLIIVPAIIVCLIRLVLYCL